MGVAGRTTGLSAPVLGAALCGGAGSMPQFLPSVPRCSRTPSASIPTDPLHAAGNAW
jgi:hypothetical protein